MKKQIQSILIGALLPVSLVLTKNDAYAQGDAAQLIRAGAADATVLSQAYLNPLFKGIGFGMNSAWYNSAKTKNLGKFDLKIQATGALVPTSDRTFDINSLNLSKTRVVGPSGITPTAFGDDTEGPQIEIRENVAGVPTTVATFRMPQGSGFNIVPSPQVQLTVGLIKNTDVSLRFTPKVGGGDFGKVGSWGIGVKKEITSLLPAKSEKIIPVDIALAFGYNQLTYDYNIAVEDQIGEEQNPDFNQRVEGKFSGYTIDAILSKKLAVFTPFISVGYNNAKTDLGILGKYRIKSGITSTQVIEDPVKIKQTDISGVRANVGFALHLAFFRLYGAYNIGEYQAVTAGIGFGIGK